MLSFLLFLQASSASVVTPTTLSVVVAVVTGLNALGVFAILFQIGLYIGTTNSRLKVLEDKDVAYATDTKEVKTTLSHHGESLTRLETQMGTIINDIKVVRARQHDFANTLNQLTLSPVTMRPLRPRSDEEKE